MQQLDGNGKPVVDDHFIRTAEAESVMKSAHNARQTLFVCGPTGFGKTSFVADMLSRRRYHYLQAGLLEKMIQEIDTILASDVSAKETIVVIDDLQFIESVENRERVMPKLQGLMERRDIWLILISRAEVPSWLKALYIQFVFIVIDEKALSFTEKDTKRYLDSWEITCSDLDIKKVMAVVKGYPLAVRIFAMRFLSYGKNTGLGSQMVEEAIKRGYADLYDYFDTNVIDEWSMEMQELYMDLSILDKFDAKIAQNVTKRNDVEFLLQHAKEMGSFFTVSTEGDKVIYELRPVMRDCCFRRLQLKTSKEHVDNLYYSAGSYYELTGDVTKALIMYERGQHEEGISSLLINNVRHHTGVGHYWELRRYYRDLSEDVIRKSPELMAGMCLLEAILMNDEESERWYQELLQFAKDQTGSVRRAAKMRILYLDLSLPQRGNGNILNLVQEIALLIGEKNYPLPEVSVTNNQPSIMDGGKDFCEWSKKDTQLAKSIGKVLELVLGSFGKGLVNLALAESSMEKGADYYKIAVLADRGRLQAESGGKLEQVFVGVGIMAWLAVLNHNLVDALEMLESLKKTALVDAPHIVPGIEALMTRFYLYNGQMTEVNEWLKHAPNEDEEFCTLERYRYMTKVRVYLSLGKKEKAFSLLNRILGYAELRNRTFLWIEAKILYAITAYRLGNDDWITELQEAVTKAEEYHFVRIFVREGVAVLGLLKDKRLLWKDKKYQTQVIKECEQQANYYPNYLLEKAGDIRLSDMALTILRMQADGFKNEEIAEKLEMSVGNVKYHNTETYKKLGVKSKAAAIMEARKRKLI